MSAMLADQLVDLQRTEQFSMAFRQLKLLGHGAGLSEAEVLRRFKTAAVLQFAIRRSPIGLFWLFAMSHCFPNDSRRHRTSDGKSKKRSEILHGSESSDIQVG